MELYCFEKKISGKYFKVLFIRHKNYINPENTFTIFIR